MALDIDKRETDSSWMVKAKGDVDLYTSPALRGVILKLLAKGDKALGVDLSEVLYMDSSGVATLVEGLKVANNAKTGFFLTAPSESVMKVLQLARLDAVFEIRNSV
ncbi:MAG TPA: STAS domain-containing protein [Candidatus Hydrogenedentes bacterium]|nr:STAS domain-containing protein [Candidatus Hydrogenedentota bacterium]